MKSALQQRAASLARWLKYRWRRFKRLPLGVLSVLVGMAVASSLVGFRGEGWKGFLQSLGPELGGAVVTYVLLDLVLGTKRRKEDLIADMGCKVREIAVRAVEELGRWGWLYDGTLQGAVLVDASLSRAELSGAALPGALLTDADLREAHLDDANLQGAKLFKTDLAGAFLIRADLTDDAKLCGTNLTGAKLQGADLTGSKIAFLDADLSGADLSGAKVTGEQLARARSLEGAILTDGKKLGPWLVSGYSWQAEFEEWRKKQEEQESDG
ncbi:MAG: pentapeptide repeat-containing protein [bacterium]